MHETKGVKDAIAMIGKPKAGGGVHTAYTAAKAKRIALSTIYRALKRRREAA